MVAMLVDQLAIIQKEHKYISYSQAKEVFHLTDKMFELIGEPDKRKMNPHYPAGPKMKLYLISRIQEWTKLYPDWIEKTRLRREKLSADRIERESNRQKIHQENVRSLIKEITEIEFEIHIKSINFKIINEVYSFCSRNFDYFSGRITLKHIVNFIRHEYTNYEDMLIDIPETRVYGEVYLHIKNKFNQSITELFEKEIDTQIVNFYKIVREEQAKRDAKNKEKRERKKQLREGKDEKALTWQIKHITTKITKLENKIIILQNKIDARMANKEDPITEKITPASTSKQNKLKRLNKKIVKFKTQMIDLVSNRDKTQAKLLELG